MSLTGPFAVAVVWVFLLVVGGRCCGDAGGMAFGCSSVMAFDEEEGIGFFCMLFFKLFVKELLLLVLLLLLLFGDANELLSFVVEGSSGLVRLAFSKAAVCAGPWTRAAAFNTRTGEEEEDVLLSSLGIDDDRDDGSRCRIALELHFDPPKNAPWVPSGWKAPTISLFPAASIQRTGSVWSTRRLVMVFVLFSSFFLSTGCGTYL